MKSHERDLVELAISIYKDAMAKCTDVLPNERKKTAFINRDIQKIVSRVEHQGVSFLTITLPNAGKSFDLALARGRLASSDFPSFKKRRRSEALPAFLQVMLMQVFEVDGGIKDEPSVAAIEGIRQITYAFKKLLVPCAQKRVNAAITQFTLDECIFEEPLDPGDVEDFLDVSCVLWSNIFGIGVNPLPYVRPRHGPGATAEHISGNAKFVAQRWHERLEPYFPVLDTAFANANAADSREFQNLELVDVDSEQPVRVIAVPKTLKKPRIIAIEPVCMQYTQQALAGYLVKVLENHHWTKGHVNFTDQSVNRGLAMSSSRDGKFATLDLSSASDRVPYSLAIRMFDSCPDLRDAVSACRSTKAQTGEGKVISLHKFASMGSALCFPVEAMYFYTICVMALLKKQNLPCTYLNIEKVSKSVYVYGDDIIVPTGASVFVSSTLQKYYCKVNARKSFTRGKFRESCGMDAFDGEEVTPTYIRHKRPGNKRDTQALVSWVATSNLLYKRGYWRTSSTMISVVESILGELPIVGPKCAGLGKVSFQKRVSAERWNRDHQVVEVKTWIPTPIYRRDPLSDNGALLKSLLKLESEGETPFNLPWGSANPNCSGWDQPIPSSMVTDGRHLERSARHGAVALKRRWTRPY